jgi:hypothetical protein
MTNRSDAADVAAGYCRTIAEDVEGAPDPCDAAADYVAGALDADYLVNSRGDVKAVHLIVGTGGPHVEVHHRIGAEEVQVRVWWWGDYADQSVHAPALAADLDGLGDAWQDAYVVTGRPTAGVHR